MYARRNIVYKQRAEFTIYDSGMHLFQND